MVTLAAAREARRDAKLLLSKGIDLGAQKKEEKLANTESDNAVTFEKVGREWYENKTQDNEAKYRRQLLERLEKKLFPFIGATPIDKLTPQDILSPLPRMWSASADAVRKARRPPAAYLSRVLPVQPRAAAMDRH